MKINIDRKFLKYALYIGITIIIVYTAFLILFNISTILRTAFSILFYIISLLKPLLIGIVIAYLLYPLTIFIESFLKNNKLYKVKNLSTRRLSGIIISYICVIGILIGIICGIYFMIGGQLSKNITISNIIDEIYNYINSDSFSPSSITETIENLNIPFIGTLQPYAVEAVNLVQKYLTNNLGHMTNSIVSLGSSVATFIIAIIISIYLLKDREYFFDLSKKLYTLIFKDTKTGHHLSYVFCIIHNSFGKFIHGQLLEALFVGLLSCIFLKIAGIDYSFVIGLISGICNLIPYAGPIIGTILAAIIGLLSGAPIKALYAVAAMLIVQQIDNHFLAPKIVGDSVGLHPVFTMMAILIGGNVGGLIGMLIAVPLAASFKVLFNNWYDRKINTNS